MPITSFIRMLPSGKREDSLLPKEPPSLRSPLFTNYFRLHTFQPKQDIKRDQIKSQKATKADKAAKKVSPGSLFLITPAMQPQNSPTKKSLTATTRHLLPKELDHQKSRPPPKTNEKKKNPNIPSPIFPCWGVPPLPSPLPVFLFAPPI